MIEQRRKRPELPSTCPARAVIHLFLMYRRIDVSVQTLEFPEALVAQVAFVEERVAIVGCRSSRDARTGVGVRQELLCDEVVRVAAADFGQDGVAVELASF